MYSITFKENKLYPFKVAKNLNIREREQYIERGHRELEIWEKATKSMKESSIDEEE